MNVTQLRHALERIEAAGYGSLPLLISLNAFEATSVDRCVVVQQAGEGTYVELGELVGAHGALVQVLFE
jgi:hypothetical protein